MALKHIFILVFAVLAVGFISAGLYNALAVRYYTVCTGDRVQTENRIRIALITDLHSCRYGEDQKDLISAIDAQSPDMICMSGDIFDDKLPDDNTAKFIASVSKKYPCWYVTGNHEYRSGKDAFDKKMEILDGCGVKRLSGECDTVNIKGRTVNICGIDDREAYLIYHEYECEESSGKDYYKNIKPFLRQIDDAAEQADNGNYTILLSHRPEYYSYYQGKGFDLVLCGHAHGGQWRIPGILNGLFAPNQGLFPKYAGGMYDFEYIDEEDAAASHMTMIVSRGLAKTESTIIPRFYNRPEIVIIDIE